MADSLPKEDQLLSGWPEVASDEYDRNWIERVKERTIVAEDGCWLWRGPVHTKGYAQFTYRGTTVRIHRKLYELTHGLALSPEQFVCHRCDVRNCINPGHLWLGDPKANNRDCGNKGRHHNGVKTHCKRGHPFTPENTYLKVTPTTVMRSCLTCEKIRANWPEYKAKALERQRRKKRQRKSSQVSI